MARRPPYTKLHKTFLHLITNFRNHTLKIESFLLQYKTRFQISVTLKQVYCKAMPWGQYYTRYDTLVLAVGR
jgi:hypothetical protein